jgi:aryl-phospho-beta-D-glucosidase BglC (GH1 family)
MLTNRKPSLSFRRLAARILLSAIAATPLHAANWSGLKVQGQNIVDANGQNFVPKGFAVGEWTNVEAYMLEWPDGTGKYLWYYGDTRIHGTLEELMGASAADQYWQTWKANIVTEDDVARWARWGVNTVRFSINYHWLSPADGVYLDSGWQWIDQMVAWCKAHHIYVVLCMHAAPGAQNPELMSDTADGKPHLWTQPTVYQPWTIDLWQAIAQRYANELAVAGYDLLDEPLLSESDYLKGGKIVRAFYVKTTAAIRSVDSNHIIFACGMEYCGSTAGMKAMLPAWDNNMVLVFHKYWDYNNRASIQGFLDIRAQNNVPIWNGETGENGNAWAASMVKLLGENNIGWSWWTYKKVNQTANPCMIAEPAHYNKIVEYVRGKGPKPPQADADTIMLELADNSATSKCTWNNGLVKALFGRPAD